MLGRGLLINLQATNDTATVVRGEEGRFVGEIKHHPERRNTHEDRRQTLEDENPGPAIFASYMTHLADCRRQKPAKGPRDGRGGEEDGGSDAEFTSPVPAGEVVVDTREQASFCQAQEEPRGHQTLEVMAQAHGRHDYAPQDHDQRNENAGSKALEEHVGQGFGQCVGDEEDGQGSIVLATCHVEILLQAIQFCVADIGSVEKTDEVQQTEPWDESQIELPQELLILRNKMVSGRNWCWEKNSTCNGSLLGVAEMRIRIGWKLMATECLKGAFLHSDLLDRPRVVTVVAVVMNGWLLHRGVLLATNIGSIPTGLNPNQKRRDNDGGWRSDQKGEKDDLYSMACPRPRGHFFCRNCTTYLYSTLLAWLFSTISTPRSKSIMLDCQSRQQPASDWFPHVVFSPLLQVWNQLPRVAWVVKRAGSAWLTNPRLIGSRIPQPSHLRDVRPGQIGSSRLGEMEAQCSGNCIGKSCRLDCDAQSPEFPETKADTPLLWSRERKQLCSSYNGILPWTTCT